MGKYLNTRGTKCIHCHSNLYPMDLVINSNHLYPIGIMYRCGLPCNRTQIWTNSIRGDQRGYRDLISYLQGDTDRFVQGVCNDLFCGKCFGYIQCLKNGYSWPGAHRKADLYGCRKCDNQFAAWTDLYDEENPDDEDKRSYYGFYKFYTRKLEELTKLISSDPQKNPRKKKEPLVKAVSQTIDRWMLECQERTFCTKNEWIKGIEGEIYVRYSYSPKINHQRLDLASFSILPKYQQKGIAKALIAMACQKPIKTVKVELIHALEWGAKVRHYQFPGRQTIIEGEPYTEVISVIWEKEDQKRRNPYRRNTDTQLRAAERRWRASETWNDKLFYNVECIRAGVIPPPDVEVIEPWDQLSEIEFMRRIRNLRHPTLWSPEENEIQRHFRRWHFPGGWGVSVSYHANNPIPGGAPYAHTIPLDKHEVEGILFRFDDAAARKGPEEDFGTCSLECIKLWPPEGAPDLSYLSWSVTRFLRSDQQTLLNLLQEAASGTAKPERRNPVELPLSQMQESSCDCEICRAMCHRTPCWPTPQEADHLLDAGYAAQLDLEYYQGFDRSTDNFLPVVWAVVPELRGTEMFPQGCTFQTETGLCELHEKCQPLEGRLAHHSGTPLTLRKQVAMLWDTSEGRRVVERFKRMESRRNPDERDPDLVNSEWRAITGEDWPRPANWKYPEDWGSPAWKRRMKETYQKSGDLLLQYGFEVCPKCGTQHSGLTMCCRRCNHCNNRIR